MVRLCLYIFADQSQVLNHKSFGRYPYLYSTYSKTSIHPIDGGVSLLHSSIISQSFVFVVRLLRSFRSHQISDVRLSYYLGHDTNFWLCSISAVSRSVPCSSAARFRLAFIDGLSIAAIIHA